MFNLSAGIGFDFAPSGTGIIELSDSDALPSLNASLAFLPFRNKKRSYEFGLIASAFYQPLKSSADFYSVKLNLIEPSLNLCYRHRISSNNVKWQARGGAGFAIISKNIEFTSDNEDLTQPENTLFGYMFANAGLSLVITPGNVFSIEMGSDVSYIFAEDLNTPMVKPFASIGVRF